jgi:hypothetical protein
MAGLPDCDEQAGTPAPHTHAVTSAPLCGRRVSQCNLDALKVGALCRTSDRVDQFCNRLDQYRQGATRCERL